MRFAIPVSALLWALIILATCHYAHAQEQATTYDDNGNATSYIDAPQGAIITNVDPESGNASSYATEPPGDYSSSPGYTSEDDSGD